MIEAYLKITNPKRYMSVKAVIQDARKVTGPLIHSAIEIAMALRQRVPKDELRTMKREQLVDKFNEIFADDVARFGEKLT